MKLTRPRTLGTLGIAGTLVGATLVLAAPQASARPDAFTTLCNQGGGQVGLARHYEFDLNGDMTYTQTVYTCNTGGNVIWNDVDIMGNPYG